MKKKYNILISLLFCMILGFAGCSSNNLTDATEGTAEKSLGESQTLTIIHVNDVHGNVEESDIAIGYAKMAAFIDMMKREDPNTIALDAGDTFGGTPNAAFDQGESIVPILNTVAFDAMVLGNVVTTDGEYLWEPSMVITLGNGLKVGIVTATCGILDGLEFLNPIESLQSQVNEIRSDVDIVIALLHLGVEDFSGNTSQLVASEVEGVDVIVDGHSHIVLEKGIEVNGVLIGQTGESCQNIGIMELTITDGVIESVSSHLIAKEELMDAEAKEETLAATEALLVKSAEYFAQIIGETTVDLIGTRERVRTEETNLGNFVADAIKDTTGAEIAVCTAGFIGGEIPTGEITKKDILSIARATTSFVIGEMKGADIIAAINNHISECPEPSGSFLQVSGISFKIDPNQAVGERVHSVYVGDKEIDSKQTYTVAYQELLKDAVGFNNSTIIKSGFPQNDVIIENYIIENSPISPEVEGRIVIKTIS